MKGTERRDFRPAFASAAETADAIRTKPISTAELVSLIYERIDRHNPASNAVILPAGLQILAPMWEDGTSIEFAALLSEIAGGFSVPEGFSN
jgi:Asp-tRNA(Asn)/Glu-tRNA(Gln) amidotransferase A subunit family amidase